MVLFVFVGQEYSIIFVVLQSREFKCMYNESTTYNVVGPPGTSFAQRLGLGWVVVGEFCVGDFNAKNVVNVSKLHT